MFAPSPQLHLTVLMLDLADPERLQLAKETLLSLQPRISEDIMAKAKSLDITLEGLKSHQNKLSAVRILYTDIVKDESFEKLQLISDAVISKFLEVGVVTEKELSHIKFNEKKLWTPEYHLTIIRANRKPFDATQLMADFGDSSLGKFTLNDLHISSRSEFETPDGVRKSRKEFSRDDEATFACESKILLK